MMITRTKAIYLDYASLTPVDPRVQKVINQYSVLEYSNPSSIYKTGLEAKKALEYCREIAAESIGAHPDEMIFTAGGTEANNIAILGAIENLRIQGIKYGDMHVLASAFEHSSVLECFKHLGTLGVQVEFINIDSNGIISLDDLKKKLRPNTVFVSVMTVNNEIGTVQPVREVARIIRNYRSSIELTDFRDLSTTAELPSFCSAKVGRLLSSADAGTRVLKYPLFHTDAAQASLLDLNVEKLGVDMLTLDGSKVYGPRGIGCLYVKRNTSLSPIIHGGGQEKGLCSGTENIPAIMGFARALDIAKEEREEEIKRLTILRELFISKLKTVRADIIIHGQSALVSPHILNISIPGINNELFLLRLDARGVEVSTKSSCLGDQDESYALKAIGADSKTALRFSFGRWTKERDIDKTIKVIGDIF